MASTAVESGAESARLEWDSAPHPWRRYGARTLDVTIFGGITLFVAEFTLIFAWPSLAAFLAHPPLWATLVVISPLTVASAAVGVALCHARWGSTPGKWIFRLRVASADGQRMTRRQAFLREALLFVWGFGLGVPLLSLVALFNSYSDLENDDPTHWDRKASTLSEARVIHGAAYAWLVIGFLLAIGDKLFGMVALVAR